MMKKIRSLLLAGILVLSLSAPAFAAEFTPSVESKAAPEVVTQKDSSGNECAAIIYDADGKELVGVPTDDLIVTPVSSTDDTVSAEVKAALESAYEQLQSVSSLAELSSDLESVIKEVSADLTLDDLVVRDLFDVTVTGAYAEYLSQDGASISIRFKLSADAESLAAVLHNVEGTTWETVSNDRITRNSDYTADVVFYSLSPVAFLFDAGKLDVDPDAPNSPQTGEPASYAVWFAAGGVIIIAAVASVIVKKRSSKKA